jgi:phosphohistidine phosphatase
VKRLILLRHAKSSWTNDRLSDSERPLSGRGERDAPRMGARLLEKGFRPSLVLSSPAERARRTAVLVAAALRYPVEAIRLEPALYLATADEILAVLATQADSVDCLLVIGHNPGLTDLAHRLLPEFALTNLATAALLVIDCETDRWSKVEVAARRLVHYDYPKSRGRGATAD